MAIDDLRGALLYQQAVEQMQALGLPAEVVRPAGLKAGQLANYPPVYLLDSAPPGWFALNHFPDIEATRAPFIVVRCLAADKAHYLNIVCSQEEFRGSGQLCSIQPTISDRPKLIEAVLRRTSS